ncbi:hypothetical protein [Neptunomonas qingdaonensis]|uniref:Uncharacterized protein n=1 Tax=Neptunomonas qingdaonensis TaxID=1045558 RepID=A0A1I2MY89_9GAMM|nr:hypothetical protein [Neptunomonas qingdaonensis]SFF94437.1 hypothetical protein SAMN05216175_10264 [Neptunomonas qingdaonensis]
MKDKMDRPKNDELLTEQQESTGKKPSDVDSSRRRLFGAGIAAPVILSMSGRTAWGGALCAASAHNSATFISHHPKEAPDCDDLAGLSPSTWAESPGMWPSTGYIYDSSIGQETDPGDIATKCEAAATAASYPSPYAGTYEDSLQNVYCRYPQSFDTIFGVSLFNDGTTLLEVLLTSPENSVERHAVAGLLNAASGQITLGRVLGAIPTPATVVTKVIDVFQSLIKNGYYTLPSTQQHAYWNTDPENIGFTMYDYFNTYAG